MNYIEKEFLLKLVKKGIIKWNGKKLKKIKPVAKVKGNVSDLIIENRR